MSFYITSEISTGINKNKKIKNDEEYYMLFRRQLYLSNNGIRDKIDWKIVRYILRRLLKDLLHVGKCYKDIYKIKNILKLIKNKKYEKINLNYLHECISCICKTDENYNTAEKKLNFLAHNIIKTLYTNIPIEKVEIQSLNEDIIIFKRCFDKSRRGYKPMSNIIPYKRITLEKIRNNYENIFYKVLYKSFDDKYEINIPPLDKVLYTNTKKFIKYLFDHSNKKIDIDLNEVLSSHNK